MRKLLATCCFALSVLYGAPVSAAPFPSLSSDVGVCDPNSPTHCIAPNSDGSVNITGSFSASISSFVPSLSYATLTATAASSASTALPTNTGTVAFQNQTAVAVSCTLSATSATALVNQIIVPAGSTIFIGTTGYTSAACINQTGSASNVIVLAGGSGLGTGFGGGSAGGGGGSVTQGTDPWLVAGKGTAGTPSGGVVTVQGAASMTKLLVTPDSVALPANQSVNVSQINGVTPLMGNGGTGTGSPRVTIASDNTAFSVNATLAAETTKVIGTVRVASGGIASGAIASGAVASGAYSLGAFASGAYSSGSIAAGAMVDLLTVIGTKNNGTAATSSLLGGLVYNSSPLTLTTTQQASLQGDANGYLKVNVAAGGAGGGAVYGPTAVGAANANPPVVVGGTATGAAGQNVVGVAIKPASTAPVATDTAIVVTESPNSPLLTTASTCLAGTTPTTSSSATTGTVTGIQCDLHGNIYASPTSQYPAGAVPITASATGTTAATTATLAGTSGKTTYICSMSIRSNATAAATGNATVTGTITATLNYTHWTAPLASGIGLTEMIFPVCIPASGTNTGIAVISPAPGSGGVVSVTASGYQL